MDLLLLSTIDWRQPVPRRYDICVGMTDYADSSASQLQTAAKKNACCSEPTLLSKYHHQLCCQQRRRAHFQ